MCKKPTLPLADSQLANLPVFKPFSAFETKHYIKKMAQRIKHTLDSLDLDDILNEDYLEPETPNTPSPRGDEQI
jgi:hypothetical protein